MSAESQRWPPLESQPAFRENACAMEQMPSKAVRQMSRVSSHESVAAPGLGGAVCFGQVKLPGTLLLPRLQIQSATARGLLQGRCGERDVLPLQAPQPQDMRLPSAQKECILCRKRSGRERKPSHCGSKPCVRQTQWHQSDIRVWRPGRLLVTN